MLIAIHRDSFQHMISGSDEVSDSDADLVPVSSGSIASRALRSFQAIRGRGSGSSYVDPEAGPSSPERSLARATSFTLKNSFSASESSRSDQSPDVSAPQRILLERAVTARATMKAWCDLRGLAPMKFVTMPLPEPLQELQVRAHRSAVWTVSCASRRLLGPVAACPRWGFCRFA